MIHALFNQLFRKASFKRQWIDVWLCFWATLLITLGGFVLYSACDENVQTMFRQFSRFGLGLTAMLGLAQIPPARLRQWASLLYAITLSLLVAVLIIGEAGNGAQRWLHLGPLRIQPSELMKLTMPIMFARIYHDRALPPDTRTHSLALMFAAGPILATAVEPDLGTALMLTAATGAMMFLTGIAWRAIGLTVLGSVMALPVLWAFMAPYQKGRVLTFLNPARDPLGSGYHIIQSKIALGSGGLWGKGWFQSTQSHLNFLPEHTTDFIFSVLGEEFGFAGGVVLITLFLFVTWRGLQIGRKAQDTFSRLLAGGLMTIFFLSAFVNIGMVTGLLPVVGLPLPLVSYGGTSLVTLMASLGIVMSIHNHKQLISH